LIRSSDGLFIHSRLEYAFWRRDALHGGNMEARIIIPTAEGDRLNYELRLHQGGGRDELKIVFNTSEEIFERWLFYLLRDLGAHIVTDDPERLRSTLGLTRSEPGVIAQDTIPDVDATRHVVKT
jgi:hypothetical protein